MHVDLWEWTAEIDETLVQASEAEIRHQIAEYERGTRRAFDLDVAVPDDFTGAVMDAMRAIPYGETRSYGEIAADLDTAAVAVGQASGRNPVPIVVPCHRIVGADSVGGFSADGGVDLKRALLAHEADHAPE